MPPRSRPWLRIRVCKGRRNTDAQSSVDSSWPSCAIDDAKSGFVEKEGEILAQHQGVRDARFRESFGPQKAAVAMAARMTFRSRIVAAVSQPVIESECEAATN